MHERLLSPIDRSGNSATVMQCVDSILTISKISIYDGF